MLVSFCQVGLLFMHFWLYYFTLPILCLIVSISLYWEIAWFTICCIAVNSNWEFCRASLKFSFPLMTRLTLGRDASCYAARDILPPTAGNSVADWISLLVFHVRIMLIALSAQHLSIRSIREHYHHQHCWGVAGAGRCGVLWSQLGHLWSRRGSRAVSSLRCHPLLHNHQIKRSTSVGHPLK